jgi:hypothetical protein
MLWLFVCTISASTSGYYLVVFDRISVRLKFSQTTCHSIPVDCYLHTAVRTWNLLNLLRSVCAPETTPSSAEKNLLSRHPQLLHIIFSLDLLSHLHDTIYRYIPLFFLNRRPCCVHVVGWEYVSELRSLTALLLIPRVICVCRDPWRNKPVPVPLCPPRPTLTPPGANPRLRTERPATNRLSHIAASSSLSAIYFSPVS